MKTDRGWWTIHGDDIMSMMERAGKGEDPELIYMEYYANSEHHSFDGDGNEI